MDYNDFFTFTRQERRGIVAFLVLSVTIILGFEYWPASGHAENIDLKEYYFPKDSIPYTEEQTEKLTSNAWDHEEKNKTRVFSKFAFDPNNISYDSLLLLGFSKYGAKSLTNYRSKGGKIKDVTKLKSIYGIDSILVNELNEYVRFSNNTVNNNIEKKYPERLPLKQQSIVELNSADSLMLDDIKGVGPYIAKRILTYRNKLGGYIYKEQLVELKIIADSLYQPIAEYLTVNPDLIQKININTADYKRLISHPYFEQQTVNAILNYRKQHGPFEDPKHISRIIAIKAATGQKILPYLTVE